MADACADATGERHGLEEQRAERLAHLDTLRAAGIDVQPYRFARTATAGLLHATHADLAPDTHTGRHERVAGRIAGLRGHGRLTFATIHDESGDLQLLFEHTTLAPATLTLLDNLDLVAEVAGQRLHPSMPVEAVRPALDAHGVTWDDGWGSGKLISELYDKVLEGATVGPTFVWGYPIEVSPLARRSAEDPTLADRFELVIGGREVANGYSELNDAVEQRQRFEQEAARAARGDVEAHAADLDFLYALEVGLPPTGGIGIGVDRLVMLLAGVAAIRDVLFFPLLRPEGNA